MSITMPEPLPDADARLRRLSAEAARQADLSDYAADPWTRADHDAIVPVLVVGAGHAGLTTAYGLRRSGVADVMVVDAAPVGHAGPWTTYARMQTLRTPKDVKWPTWGVPAASPRAWFEARYGEQAWEDLAHLPTRDWHAFLQWYRVTLAIDVEFDTSVSRIAGGEGDQPFRVTLSDANGHREVRARRIVLATGLEGAGGRRVPATLLGDLPAERMAHSHDAIDFAGLSGLRVGVLGGGTGAFDNAATALEHGAALVDVHMRRPSMPTVSPYRWMEFAGLIEHYAAFTDAQKWAFNVHLTTADQPATQNAIWRAHAFDAFTLRYSSPWTSATWSGEEIVVTTPQGEHRYDFVIAATGISVDLGSRPELSELADDIALWRDHLAATDRLAAPELAGYPYLDDTFALMSRSGSDDDRLGRIHLFNHGSRMSLGVLSHQISGLVGGVHRLVSGLTRHIFEERSGELLDDYLSYDTPAGVTVGRRSMSHA